MQIGIGIGMGFGGGGAGGTPPSLPQQLVSAGLLQFWYEADSGLTNLGAFGAGANLLDDTGGCAITPNLINGHACYSPIAASGGFLRTAVLSFPNGSGLNTPFHMLVVGRFGGSPALNWSMVGGLNRLAYNSATKVQFSTLAGAVTTPLNFHLHEVMHHSTNSRLGVDGSFVAGTFTTTIPFTDGGRLFIGSDNAGTHRATCDVAAVYLCDNRIPYAQYTALIDYINARFALSAAKDASYTQPENLTVTAPALWTPGNPWKAIPFLGQSNASSFGTSAATSPWGANTFKFDNTTAWVNGGEPFDSPTNQLDTASIDVSGTGNGWAGALAPLLASAYSMPVCMIPCALTATKIAWHQKSLGALKRGYLYGSAVWRTKKAIENGATIPFAVLHQGEAEASGGTQAERDAWPALAAQYIADFRADVGLPNLPFIVALVRNSVMASGYVDMHDNKIPLLPGLVAHVATVDVPVAGPFNVDGVHLSGTGLDTMASNANAVRIAQGW